MRSSVGLFALACSIAVPFAPRDAHASAAWGDAALTGDDVRVAVDAQGRARVEHELRLRVSGKRFRSFIIDGVDEGLVAPSDAEHRDGPGWAATTTDAAGHPIEALVEPAKEPRRLRVKLGRDGVGRGEYVVHVAYDVDLVERHAFVREGNVLRLAWSGPSWPEGFDRGHVVFSFPIGGREPTAALADPVDGDRGATRPLDGVALATLTRRERDELSLERPHVPAHDDARWMISIDRRALVAVDAKLGRPDDAAGGPVAAAGVDPLRDRRAALGLALGFAALVGVLVVLRDRLADRAAASWNRGPLRALIPASRPWRALGGGLGAGLIAAAAVTRLPALALVGWMAAFACAMRVAPTPSPRPRGEGRWLMVPEGALPSARPPRVGPFDLAFISGRLASLLLLAATALGIWFAQRRSVELAGYVAIASTLLVPLVWTGTSMQLPLHPASAAHHALRPMVDALARVGLVARWCVRRDHEGEIVDVRLRLTTKDARLAAQLRDAGVRGIELATTRLVGFGAERYVPECLFRVADDGPAAARLREAIDETAPESARRASFVASLGREPGERVWSARGPALDGDSYVALAAWLVARAAGTDSLRASTGVAQLVTT